MTIRNSPAARSGTPFAVPTTRTAEGTVQFAGLTRGLAAAPAATQVRSSRPSEGDRSFKGAMTYLALIGCRSRRREAPTGANASHTDVPRPRRAGSGSFGSDLGSG